MLTIKQPLKILSLIPGTRYLAIAIFYDADLRDWRIKDIRGGGIEERIKRTKNILSAFIDQYDPDVLAIKKFDSFRSSINLNRVVREIKEFARRRDLKVYPWTWAEIKESFVIGKGINKIDLAKMITDQYPELISDFEKEQQNRNPYYLKEFEAVALGSSCFYQLDKQ